MCDFFLNVVAGIIGIVFVLFIDRTKRPLLIIEQGEITYMEPGDQLGRKEAAFPYIKITNKPIYPLWGFFHDREPAYACKAWITFLDLNNKNLFKEEMLGRWTKNPEPHIYEIKKNNKIFRQIISIRDTFDIHPNEPVSLNTIVKIKDDKNCYGWSDFSYLHGWDNSDWEITEGKFIIQIRIRTGGREFVKKFGIENNENYKELKFFQIK